MTLDATASGIFPIAPTPFHADGRVDEKSLNTLINRYLSAGAAGVTVLGMMGEAPRLEPEESILVADRFIKGFGKLPVIVGVSAPGFAAMRALSTAVMDKGAAGVMIAPPSSLRTDEQIVSYYRHAIEAIGSDVPFVLQDFPLATSVQMSSKVIRRIVEDHKSCVILKHEDWPGLEKVSTLRRFQSEGTMGPLSILSGNGGLFFDFDVERGVDGAMTGYAFPEVLGEIIQLQKEGKRDEAHDIFGAHLPLVRYEHQQGVGLATRKYVMMKRGFIASDVQRKPGTALTDKARAEVDYLLSRIERRTGRK